MDKRTAKASIARYTLAGCLEAYRIHTELGEGASSVALSYNIPNVRTTRQADAAINAGRYIHNNESAQASK